MRKFRHKRKIDLLDQDSANTPGHQGSPLEIWIRTNLLMCTPLWCRRYIISRVLPSVTCLFGQSRHTVRFQGQISAHQRMWLCLAPHQHRNWTCCRQFHLAQGNIHVDEDSPVMAEPVAFHLFRYNQHWMETHILHRQCLLLMHQCGWSYWKGNGINYLISISLSQLVEQLFIQLDKDNTGFIHSSTLLEPLPSSDESSTSPSVSPAPSWGVITHSPSSPPCVLHTNEHKDDSLPNSLATTALFGSLDTNNLGWVDKGDILPVSVC